MTTWITRLRGSAARLAGSRAGNAATEFGLASPLLVMIAIGAVDYGSAYVEAIRLSGAAHAGAERALYDARAWEDTDQFERTALEEYAGRALSADEMSRLPVSASASAFCGCNEGVTIACSATCPGPSSAYRFVRVSLDREVPLLLPYPWLDTSSLNVAGDAVVRVR